MKNTYNTIFGLKSERLAIVVDTLKMNQYFHEVDTFLTYVWDSSSWIRVSDSYSGLPIRKFLTESFDGLGEYNLNGNYSTTTTNFGYTVVNRPFTLHSLLFTVTDNTNFHALDFGGISSGLTNGISLWLHPVGQDPIPLVFSSPVKHNYDWFTHIAGTFLTTFSGPTQTLTIPLDIVSDYGVPLSMMVGDSIYISLNDDFTSLVSQTFGIRGISH